MANAAMRHARIASKHVFALFFGLNDRLPDVFLTPDEYRHAFYA
jgi:hypothetical protein